MQRLVKEHGAERADHAERLWALSGFEMWQRQFLDGEPLAGTLPEVQEASREVSDAGVSSKVPRHYPNRACRWIWIPRYASWAMLSLSRPFTPSMRIGFCFRNIRDG